MKGCRPLTTQEVSQVLASFGDDHRSTRNRCLFTLGLNTGLRVSELLSIQVGDLAQLEPVVKIHTSVHIRQRAVKGQTEGRIVRLNTKARAALHDWLTVAQTWRVTTTTRLFCSQRLKPISRVHTWRIFNQMFAHIGLQGVLGTHCMRKTFADRMYDLLGGDLKQLQGALGHKWITSTSQYLSFKEDAINDAIDLL